MLVSGEVWRVKIPKKIEFFIWQVLLGRMNTLGRLAKKMPSLMGPSCRILCQKAGKHLDHLLWDCQLATFVWSQFFQEFNLQFAGQRRICATIKDLLGRKASSYGLGVCCRFGQENF